MSSLEIGQTVEIDVFGLRLPGMAGAEAQVTGTIIEMGPGTITVRVEQSDTSASDVTVSPGRLRF